eukprot:500622-Rhodomonas_salina.1
MGSKIELVVHAPAAAPPAPEPKKAAEWGGGEEEKGEQEEDKKADASASELAKGQAEPAPPVQDLVPNVPDEVRWLPGASRLGGCTPVCDGYAATPSPVLTSPRLPSSGVWDAAMRWSELTSRRPRTASSSSRYPTFYCMLVPFRGTIIEYRNPVSVSCCSVFLYPSTASRFRILTQVSCACVRVKYPDTVSCDGTLLPFSATVSSNGRTVANDSTSTGSRSLCTTAYDAGGS